MHCFGNQGILKTKVSYLLVRSIGRREDCSCVIELEVFVQRRVKPFSKARCLKCLFRRHFFGFLVNRVAPWERSRDVCLHKILENSGIFEMGRKKRILKKIYTVKLSSGMLR